eukprot:TRINITY_DN15959_c0_g1_i1.p1 TRINITY_DN15959_c0_g1~~TRINITY_DN15959_c0_g1_i1.p1  ORF type:complete len:165 (-),score=33.91 TRINITY_DN15959_c0_g1_i1:448-906(-)
MTTAKRDPAEWAANLAKTLKIDLNTAISKRAPPPSLRLSKPTTAAAVSRFDATSAVQSPAVPFTMDTWQTFRAQHLRNQENRHRARRQIALAKRAIELFESEAQKAAMLNRDSKPVQASPLTYAGNALYDAMANYELQQILLQARYYHELLR